MDLVINKDIGLVSEMVVFKTINQVAPPTKAPKKCLYYVKLLCNSMDLVVNEDTVLLPEMIVLLDI